MDAELSLADPLKVTLKLTAALEALGIRYAVGGSLASSLHGVPRATQDVDVVAEVGLGQIDALAGALDKDFVVEPPAMREAVLRRSSFNIIDREEVFKLDVFVPGADPLARSQMDRRMRYELAGAPGATLYLCCAEDTVAHKLYWYQLGGRVSERQWTDALNVLRVQAGALDMDYLNRVAAARGVAELLDKALAEAQSAAGGS